MAAAVITVTKVTGTGFALGNRKARFFDITADTGDYAAGGFTLAPSNFGLKKIDMVIVGSNATDGTAGATAEVIGVRYSSGSAIFQLYQTGTSADTPMNEKGAEAYAANFTVRCLVIGY